MEGQGLGQRPRTIIRPRTGHIRHNGGAKNKGYYHDTRTMITTGTWTRPGARPAIRVGVSLPYPPAHPLFYPSPNRLLLW